MDINELKDLQATKDFLKNELGNKYGNSSFNLNTMIEVVDKAFHSNKTKKLNKPTKLKIGDVFLATGLNYKRRPFVVAKIKSNGAYAIPLTSEENDFCNVEVNSRFFNGCLCNYLVYAPESFILNNFIGILEDNKSIRLAYNNIIKELI